MGEERLRDEPVRTSAWEATATAMSNLNHPYRNTKAVSLEILNIFLSCVDACDAENETRIVPSKLSQD